jgi:hypothetical protein
MASAEREPIRSVGAGGGAWNHGIYYRPRGATAPPAPLATPLIFTVEVSTV